MHIGPKNPKCYYLLENTPIRNVPENEPVRDLGIYFSKNLKWRSHIEIIVTKSRRTSYALLKSIKSNDPTFLISMFKVYVLPILEFGCPIFNPHYSKDIEQIEKVQRDYVRLVFKRSFEHSKDKRKNPTLAELYAKYELELLELRRLKICLKLFHQFIHGNLPLSHNNAFQIVESKTRGETYKIVTKPTTTDVRANSFFINTSKIYSQLPQKIRQNSVKDFAKSIENCDLSKFIVSNNCLTKHVFHLSAPLN